MKKTTKILSITLLLVLAVSLTACVKPDGPNTNSGSGSTEQAAASDPIKAADLIGTWKGTDGEPSTMTFYKDANYLDDAGMAKIEGTYSVDEALQTITVYEKDYGMTFTYHMKMEGEKLVIQLDGGLPRKFVKA